jgi:excisionase family DNA binding protein
VPRFLTTHQIANLIGVSERTVANWIDRGHLEAFRTPGGHRRVSPQGLRQFLNQRGIPVPEELCDDIRILIVEDDPMVAQTLKGHLTANDSGYEVTTIGDGVSALIHIGDRKPHIVLLDIVMPGMDGLAVCRKISENPELRDVQVIFITGRTDLDVETIKRDTGARDVLLKPVRGAELRETVERALHARTAATK